ncbi:MAG: hypothetical protein JO182_31925 [Acidobacteriaceae bacterium]|nr:hypothetical protein [Acidobacteriaceae bacterium]MBV9225207.1 hypothetical protein [Acidobacteriaceae bacterium]
MQRLWGQDFYYTGANLRCPVVFRHAPYSSRAEHGPGFNALPGAPGRADRAQGRRASPVQRSAAWFDGVMQAFTRA